MNKEVAKKWQEEVDKSCCCLLVLAQLASMLAMLLCPQIRAINLVSTVLEPTEPASRPSKMRSEC